MSPADVDVVRRDRDLPDLGLLLDADRFAACLARTCGQHQIAGVTIAYLRYKPGQSCLAACRAEVDGQQVDMIAKAYGLSAIGKRQKALMRPAVPGPLGPGRFLLDSTNVVVSVFPNDAKLERLARLMTPESLTELAARIGYRRGAADRLEALRHNPERRFVGRLIADARAIATVRCYTANDYAGMVEKARALRSRGPLRIASRVTRMHRLRVLAFEWLHGDVLEDAITRRSVRPDALELVGAALAHLHGQESPSLPRRTGAAEAAAVVAIADHLGRLHPPVAGLADRLTGRLAALLEEETATPRPLHGDFYAKQVLLDGERAALIDLDEASLGDPAIDLARFRADLEATVVSGRLDASEIEGIVEPLLDGYRHTRGGLPANLDLQVAAQLLRVTAHPFRRREPSWPEIAMAIVECAETFLDRAAKAGSARIAGSARAGGRAMLPLPLDAAGSSVASGDATSLNVADPFGVTSDSLMPFLAQALNPGEMAPRFARALKGMRTAEDIHVRRISVMRHKPGRRCLIAYDLTVRHASGTIGELAVVGKARARGADTSTHKLLVTLWDGSFGALANDGIFVPEPLGIVRDVHMGVQRRVSGEPLTRLLEGPAGLRLARRAAEAIHKLHRVSATARRRHTMEDEMRILRAGLTAVEREYPRWYGRIERLFDGCMRLAARIPEGSLCGIHRDFYPDQVLVDGDRLYVTDLDLYAEGPPALDVGNFLAHVEEYSLRHFGDPDHLADRNEMLIERYLQLSDRTTTREAIHAWGTLSLARHVAISRLFVERHPFTAALLDLCERRVSDNDRETTVAYGRQKGAQQ